AACPAPHSPATSGHSPAKSSVPAPCPTPFGPESSAPCPSKDGRVGCASLFGGCRTRSHRAGQQKIGGAHGRFKCRHRVGSPSPHRPRVHQARHRLGRGGVHGGDGRHAVGLHGH